MGLLMSRVFNKLLGKKNEFKILILGLANAGKTTLLYQLKLGQSINSQATIGCNIEEVMLENVKVQAWDMGGQESLRNVWHSYYPHSAGVVFMVDSAEYRQDYIHAARQELQALLSHEAIIGLPLLFLANKADLSNSQQEHTISTLYGLQDITTHNYHLQLCSAKNNQGVQTAFHWLVQAMLNNNQS